MFLLKFLLKPFCCFLDWFFSLDCEDKVAFCVLSTYILLGGIFAFAIFHVEAGRQEQVELRQRLAHEHPSPFKIGDTVAPLISPQIKMQVIGLGSKYSVQNETLCIEYYYDVQYVDRNGVVHNSQFREDLLTSFQGAENAEDVSPKTD